MADEEKNRGNLFVAGQSGNPGGMSKERAELLREARAYLASNGLAHIQSIETLAATARSQKVRLTAYIWLAEQFVGKPAQAITGPDGGPVQTVDLSKLTLEQLEQLDAIRRAASGEPKP